MKSLQIVGLAALTAGLVAAAPAQAVDILATAPIELAPLKMDGRKISFSVKEYTLETGKYYKWHVEGDGVEEFTVMAPELFRNSWIAKIVMNAAECPTAKCEVELYPGGAVYALQFDDPSSADVYFVPVRTGDFEFYAKGYQPRGMTGKFKVR
ncbi:MAG: hypothetical protein U1E56_02430 [Bauldia sp.]